MSASRRFSPSTMRWIVTGATISFLLAVLLTAFAEEIGGPLSSGPDTFSYSALGHRAFYELLAESGVPVTRRRSDRISAPPDHALLVAAEPNADTSGSAAKRERFSSLLRDAWLASSTLLVVLPKWTGVPDPVRPGWIVDSLPAGLDRSDEVLTLLAWEGGPVQLRQLDGATELRCETAWGDPATVSLRDPVLLEPSEAFEAVVTCGDAVLVAKLVPEEGPSLIYILSDPDLLNNQGLSRSGNALLAHALVTREIGANLVMFDETIHGFTASSGILHELFRYPLNLAVAHGGLLVVLVLWSGARRFGLPRPPPRALAGGKMTLIETSASMMEVAGKPADALSDYLRQSLRTVAARYLLPAEVSHARMIEKLRALGRARGVRDDILSLRSEVYGFRRSGTRDADILEIAARIHEWKKRMIDAA